MKNIKNIASYLIIGLCVTTVFLAGCRAKETTHPKLAKLTHQEIMQLYNPNGNMVAGNTNGNVTLVEFFDYRCKTCRKIHPELKKFIATHRSLRVIYKEDRVFGDASTIPALAGLAASRQHNYIDMHNKLMEAKKPITLDSCISFAKELGLNASQFRRDMQDPKLMSTWMSNVTLAHQLDIEVVPTIIIAPTLILTDNTLPQYMLEGDVSTHELDKLYKKLIKVRIIK